MHEIKPKIKKKKNSNSYFDELKFESENNEVIDIHFLENPYLLVFQ